MKENFQEDLKYANDTGKKLNAIYDKYFIEHKRVENIKLQMKGHLDAIGILPNNQPVIIEEKLNRSGYKNFYFETESKGNVGYLYHNYTYSDAPVWLLTTFEEDGGITYYLHDWRQLKQWVIENESSFEKKECWYSHSIGIVVSREELEKHYLIEKGRI